MNTRKIDSCVWSLWLEGFPIDIQKWAEARLARFGALSEGGVGQVDDLRKRVIAKTSIEPTRIDTRHPIYGRLRTNEENSLLLWAIDIAAGQMPAKSLYDPGSPAFDALKKAGGLDENWEPPDHELSIESFSLALIREILRSASIGELEQARHDWADIAQLVQASKVVDWHVVRNVLGLHRTSSIQPIAPADFFIQLWQNFDARAVLLAGLIHLRRSSEHSHRLSEILAAVNWMLAQCPRRTVAERTSVESSSAARVVETSEPSP